MRERKRESERDIEIGYERDIEIGYERERKRYRDRI